MLIGVVCWRVGFEGCFHMLETRAPKVEVTSRDSASASSRVVSTSSKLLPSFLFLFPTTSNLNNSTDVRPSELISKAPLDSTSISTEQFYENSGANGRAQLYCLVNPQAQSGVCSMHSYCNNSVGEAAQRKQQAQIFLPAFAEYDCDTCCLSKASWWV
jgi:hypothetical protein